MKAFKTKRHSRLVPVASDAALIVGGVLVGFASMFVHVSLSGLLAYVVSPCINMAIIGVAWAFANWMRKGLDDE